MEAEYVAGPGGLIPARAGKTCQLDLHASVATAHPRAGGENRSFIRKTDASAGSSPRGRGKHCQARMPGVMERLIPARAGKTQTMSGVRPRLPAHPRAGGENCR